MSDMTLRELYQDAAMRRVLTLTAGASPTGRQRARLSRLLLDRYSVRVSANDNLDFIINGAQEPESPVTHRLRSMKLALLTDEALVHAERQRGAGEKRANAATPAEVLHAMEKKIIAACTRAADEIGAMCEEDPNHLKEAQDLLDATQTQKKSASWLRRCAAEASEEVLNRAIKYGHNAEEDKALKKDGMKARKGKKREATPLDEQEEEHVAHGTGLSSPNTQRELREVLRKFHAYVDDDVNIQVTDRHVRDITMQANPEPCIEMPEQCLRIIAVRNNGKVHFEAYRERPGSGMVELFSTAAGRLRAARTAHATNMARWMMEKVNAGATSAPMRIRSSFVAGKLREAGREDLLAVDG